MSRIRWAVFTALCCLIAFFIPYFHFKAQISTQKPIVIQSIIRDTIVEKYPIEIEKRVDYHDTIKLVVERLVCDTIKLTDTLYLPRETKVYADTNYRAVVSGIQPRLDSIYIYQTTKIATQKEWQKFSFGIQIGGGVVQPLNGNLSLGVFVGYGVSYRF